MLAATIGVFLMMSAVELPMGSAPEPVAVPHFPDRLHAFVWRNWALAPTERLAETVAAQPGDILRMGKAMGLPDPPEIPAGQLRRSSTTIIRRNWHLLPYEQLLTLLRWTPETMAYHLREDDFLYIKLGRLKPKCEPLAYEKPDAAVLEREKEIAAIAGEVFPQGLGAGTDPLFGFVARLSQKPAGDLPKASASGFSPRFCFSYFGLTGDPLLGNVEGIYPEGYLARLAATGVDGVWLQAVLYKLAPFPWDEALSARYEERIEGLRDLVATAGKYGIGVYLYLNEPRAMPLAFFEDHPDMKGVVEGDYAAMCTSNPEVQGFIRDSVAFISRSVPDLKGFFSISASENLTNCYSHHHGAQCPRCGKRTPQEVIAEVNGLFREGIRQAGTKTELIAWDWGWADAWAEGIVNALPKDVALMSVSEWSIPIERGGVKSVTGEYSMSTIGPGPRATRHWGFARARGLKALAKVQVGTTWEIGSMPYIPVVENVAQHMANLRDADIDGLMLGWTLGGYPSPNLEIAAEMGRTEDGGAAPTPEQAMQTVAARRFGPQLGPLVVAAWRAWSATFREYPFHGGLIYCSPVHMGPANLFYASPTGYGATMVGLPYDHLTGWRACYPEEVFIGQFQKLTDGFAAAVVKLRDAAKGIPSEEAHRRALEGELDVAEACAIHFRSVANQARFVVARRALAEAKNAQEAGPHLDAIEALVRDEMNLATRLYAIQSRDSRIGYEASNHYFYVPLDLAEKVINCRDLLDRWLPAERASLAQ